MARAALPAGREVRHDPRPAALARAAQPRGEVVDVLGRQDIVVVGGIVQLFFYLCRDYNVMAWIASVDSICAVVVCVCGVAPSHHHRQAHLLPLPVHILFVR